MIPPDRAGIWPQTLDKGRSVDYRGITLFCLSVARVSMVMVFQGLPRFGISLVGMSLVVGGVLAVASGWGAPLAQAANPADLETLRETGICLDCDLRQADLRYLDLRGAVLRGANLEGANFFRADLTRADLSRANLRHTNFAMATMEDMVANLADMSHSNLLEANLNRASLIGTILTHAYLEETRLTEARLTEADMRQTKIISADFRGAHLCGAYFAYGDYRLDCP